LPLHYKVRCDCELQPVTRRFVAAPRPGVFEKSLVKPGDLVTCDQVLGRMDGRELRWELAGLEADQNRAGKSRDVNLATSKVAAAQIDRLEMERFEQKRRLVAHRLEHLEIKSPIDGIVLTGDLQRSEGVSLTIGQPLYEVAPLDELLVEVAIADKQIKHVQAGMEVTVQLDAFPTQLWTGRLERVHPRSEIRDDANVFVGEVVIDNRDHGLRPGMKGRAKVVAARHTLFWIVFHEPWEWLASWLM
jgi:multidrug resistance efflux pump